MHEENKFSYRPLAGGKDAEWHFALGLDDVAKAGSYAVRLFHRDLQSLGIETNECDKEHYTFAHLLVSESAATGKQQTVRTIGQTLFLTICATNEVKALTRTCELTSQGAEWTPWSNIAAHNSAVATVPLKWGADSSINNYTTAGTYSIAGERLNANDGLPIANSNPGHTIHARLTVLDSSIAGTGDSHDKCVTQVLTISNRTGGDGDVYIRTGRASIKNQLAGGTGWEPWGKLQQNIEVGHVTSLNSFTGNGIYSGVYTNGSTFFETFVMVVINNYLVAGATGQVMSISQFKYALNVDGTFSCKTRTGQGSSVIEWGSWVDLGAATTTDIQDGAITAQKLSSDVREKVEKVPSLEENAAKEKNALVNGDTIVGLAREVCSRQGKVDTATFLKRTTAGGTSVSDGVASIRQIGGNILKNIVDGEFEGAIVNRATASYNNGVCKIVTDKTEATSLYGDLSYGYELIAGHTYYSCLQIYNVDCKDVRVSINGGYEAAQSDEKNKWVFLSYHGIPREYSVKLAKIRAYNNREADENNMYGGNTCFVKNWFAIDLTEMFGAGNEPTKEECDKIFGTIDAIPKGLTVAQPTGLKSIGYNQWNPANVLLNKSIVENAIEDDVADRHIAIVECLPSKIGTGENNGYIIGYGEGDSWSVEGIEVYFSPLNPMDYIGQDVDLYMHKLETDSDYSSYVPQCKGYLLIVTPTIDKLCAHFHWSGDRATTDYEPYVESSVALPVIPEMSEWGLAGIAMNGTIIHDTIDLENNTYTKRIGCVDLGTLTWEKVEMQWNVYVCGEKKIYNPARLSKEYTYTTLDYNNLNRLSLSYNESDDSITISSTKGNIIAGETYTMAGQVVISKINCTQAITVKPTSDSRCGNILCVKYNTITRGQCYYGTYMNGIGALNTGHVSIVDSAFADMTENEIKASLDGILLYYEMRTPEEYPIVTKAAPNYIGSDYGVEEFTGSKVPLAANILFYMRSLVSETRNFLDRLMTGLGTSDATVVADKIIAAVNQHGEVAEIEEVIE